MWVNKAVVYVVLLGDKIKACRYLPQGKHMLQKLASSGNTECVDVFENGKVMVRAQRTVTGAHAHQAIFIQAKRQVGGFVFNIITGDIRFPVNTKPVMMAAPYVTFKLRDDETSLALQGAFPAGRYAKTIECGVGSGIYAGTGMAWVGKNDAFSYDYEESNKYKIFKNGKLIGSKDTVSVGTYIMAVTVYKGVTFFIGSSGVAVWNDETKSYDYPATWNYPQLHMSYIEMNRAGNKGCGIYGSDSIWRFDIELFVDEAGVPSVQYDLSHLGNVAIVQVDSVTYTDEIYTRHVDSRIVEEVPGNGIFVTVYDIYYTWNYTESYEYTLRTDNGLLIYPVACWWDDTDTLQFITMTISAGGHRSISYHREHSLTILNYPYNTGEFVSLTVSDSIVESFDLAQNLTAFSHEYPYYNYSYAFNSSTSGDENGSVRNWEFSAILDAYRYIDLFPEYDIYSRSEEHGRMDGVTRYSSIKTPLDSASFGYYNSLGYGASSGTDGGRVLTPTYSIFTQSLDETDVTIDLSHPVSEGTQSILRGLGYAPPTWVVPIESGSYVRSEYHPTNMMNDHENNKLISLSIYNSDTYTDETRTLFYTQPREGKPSKWTDLESVIPYLSGSGLSLENITFI